MNHIQLLLFFLSSPSPNATTAPPCTGYWKIEYGKRHTFTSKLSTHSCATFIRKMKFMKQTFCYWIVVLFLFRSRFSGFHVELSCFFPYHRRVILTRAYCNQIFNDENLTKKKTTSTMSGLQFPKVKPSWFTISVQCVCSEWKCDINFSWKRSVISLKSPYFSPLTLFPPNYRNGIRCALINIDSIPRISNSAKVWK